MKVFKYDFFPFQTASNHHYKIYLPKVTEYSFDYKVGPYQLSIELRIYIYINNMYMYIYI